MSKNKTIFATIGSLIAAGAAYVFAFRPWMLRWGASDEEVNRQLPGDDLNPNPKLKATHAITIDAPPSQAWPWIVQLGQGRGGFYSYDWVENLMGLNIHSARRINSEFQDLKVGDGIPFTPDGELSVPVVILELERIMVLHGDTRQPGPGKGPVLKEGDFLNVVWGFFLEPLPDGKTRFIERWSADWNKAFHNTFFYRVFLEPGSFIMEQKMLRTIKERAERNRDTR